MQHVVNTRAGAAVEFRFRVPVCQTETELNRYALFSPLPSWPPLSTVCRSRASDGRGPARGHATLRLRKPMDVDVAAPPPLRTRQVTRDLACPNTYFRVRMCVHSARARARRAQAKRRLCSAQARPAAPERAAFPRSAGGGATGAARRGGRRCGAHGASLRGCERGGPGCGGCARRAQALARGGAAHAAARRAVHPAGATALRFWPATA